MTWSAKITRPDGTNPTREGATAPDYTACQSCAHTEGCHVSTVGQCVVGTALTCVDVNAKTGHRAYGEAILKCAGYEPKEQ